MRMAISVGADCVMDLSVGPNLPAVRARILRSCRVPLGTVPVYEAFWRAGGRIENLSEDLLLSVIRGQAEQGVDFMTIHAGILRRLVPMALKRKLGIVSRGGAILAKWMVHHRRENPFFTRWDEIMAICSSTT